ncbi:kelch-like protein 18 [Mya arenaria]|uniref:kelch-like protein 18 n=1 Tax=Mya arenaria TaxID=6604 RepID=UPI0022E7F155|nr:kelch-like protein 18 [Mya arenaria]
MSSELQSDASLPAPREIDSAVNVNQAVMKQLYSQMMEQSDLCDITVSFGEGSMKAHLCVLVHSPYFQSMYNSGLKERQQGEVYIGIGKPKFVKMALIYLYTGKVAIEYSTIKDLLEVADYLQIDSLKEDCSRYLRDVKLTVANCVPLCLMSSLYNIEYYSDVFNFIRAHLSDVINQQEALKMSPASVTSLLADPTLSYVPREDLFNFLFRWIQFDPENRSKYFEDMFSVLDLSRMSLQFLTDILQRCKYVMSSEKCLKRTFEVVQIIRDGDVDMSDKTDAFVFSGSLNSYKNDRSVYLYAIKSKCWVKLPTLSDAANFSDAHCILNCKGDGVFLISKLPEMKNPKGCAYVSTVCSSTFRRYSTNGFTSYNVTPVAAHELGHAWIRPRYLIREDYTLRLEEDPQIRYK